MANTTTYINQIVVPNGSDTITANLVDTASGYTKNTGTVTGVTAGTGLNTTSNDATTDGGTISTSGTLYLTKSGVTAGTYNGITVDKYGRITSASTHNHSSIQSTAGGGASTALVSTDATSGITLMYNPGQGTSTTVTIGSGSVTGIPAPTTDTGAANKKYVDDSIPNTFANVKVGSDTIAADGKTDTLELVAGTGITLTADTTNDKVTITSTATGGVTDVQVNNTSIVSSGTANIVTNTAYNASTNKIATMADVDTVTITYTVISGTDYEMTISSVSAPAYAQTIIGEAY